ncbi:PAS domain-containing sensor histidine kinase [Variovorax sp. J22R115]|uniref:hybrid sensor histidine kinase/response regulator n=1 Tax=Variovorax sp. J22R115 TaxID=3053509 RepID=UPI0025759837|nr:PAS domain-containing sensor histidine kinase [Variovorax sp. J22R115]MDM0047989.1 PAS domain S-box protein [Variovorax sp. J22R115]
MREPLPFLAGGGRLGELIARHDWSTTGVGPIERWPPHVMTATALMLRSVVPIVMLWGEAGVMIYNDAYSVFAGNRHPLLLGSNVREGWPEVADFNDNVMKVGLAGGTLSYQDQELTLARNGRAEPAWMNLDYSPLLDEAGMPAGVMAVVVETTAKVQAERRLNGERERLRATEALLRTLNADLERQVEERSHGRSLFWQLTSDLLGVLDGEGVFEKTNPAWQAVLGWTEDELRITPIFDLLHPDDLRTTRDGFAKLKDGTPVVNFVNRYRCKDGTYRWLSWTGVPEEGRYYCSGRDITAEKDAQIELNMAQEALRQSQKMEAVGQLTGGIAHDFNNLLGGISASLQVLEARLAKGKVDGVERYIAMGQASVRRAAALTQRLLAFSRRQTLDPKPTDVNRLVASMEEMIRRSMGPGIEVEVIGAGGLWPTKVDSPQLENSLLNLCINARDAMPDGGRLTIETANKWLDDRAAAERELPPGQYVSLCVTDTGAGMSAEIKARCFDPFFTTKPIGQGTGLGLSMVYGFVRQSGGQVRIYSELGKGTTMCLYLPRHLGDPDQDEPRYAQESVERGDGETVLVIEDEANIRILVAEVLEQAGYRVIQADEGSRGLRLLQSRARVDLLITDVGLPGGMNGRQVADAARVTRPELKVLFITGYAENAAVGNGHLERGMEVMTKPFEITALANKVRGMVGP